MSDVSVTIGPRTYTIACGPGEEAHVGRLGQLVDAHYAKLGQKRATNEAQNLVLAALFMADALAEARAQIERSSSDAPALDRLAEALEALADKAESEASALEAGAKVS